MVRADAVITLWEKNKALCVLPLCTYIAGVVAFTLRANYFADLFALRRSMKDRLSLAIRELKNSPKYDRRIFDYDFVNVLHDRRVVCLGQVCVSTGMVFSSMLGIYGIVTYPLHSIVLHWILSVSFYFVAIAVLKRQFRTSPTVCNTNLDSFKIFPEVNMTD